PSLRRALAEALDLPYQRLLADRGARYDGAVPSVLTRLDESSPVRSNGDLVERLELLGRSLLAELQGHGFDPHAVPALVERAFPSDGLVVREALDYVSQTLVPSLDRTTDEIGNLLRGLDGRYVPAGPSGAPTRGQANALPTGRNFYSVDPNTIPSPNAWDTGV